MSNSPEPEMDLELHFLPAWAKQSPNVNLYANYQGGGDRGDRGPRGRRDRGPRPPGLGDRPRRPDRGDRPRGPGRPGENRGPAPGAGRPRPPVEPPETLPDVGVSLVPEEKGVESLARQIKLTGRAYPVFDIAHLILGKPDRYTVTLEVVKKPDGTVVQPLWVCNLDETLWLSQDDAIQHVLRKHFDTLYQVEKTPGEPPKGTYTFVAQCSLSGLILGPPNFHDYQTKLRKLHATRFARMPFEAYRSRVRIVKDEAVVKQWVEEQSWKTEFVCLNVPEPLKLPNREEVEKHFREVHAGNLIRQTESWSAPGTVAQQQPANIVRRLVRQAWEDQQRFPLRLVTVLSQQFASHGLQFFKVNKTVTHVCVARPHHLDLDLSPVSDGIRRIVQHIDAHPACTRRHLVDTLAPTPAVPATAAAPTPAPEGETPAAAAPAPSEAPKPPEPSPEQTAVIADLHWLVHQGHVIEFANGRLETAKKPKPKPPPRPPRASPVGTPEALVDQAALGVETPATASEDAEAAPVNVEAAPPAPEPQDPPTEAVIGNAPAVAEDAAMAEAAAEPMTAPAEPPPEAPAEAPREPAPPTV